MYLIILLAETHNINENYRDEKCSAQSFLIAHVARYNIGYISVISANYNECSESL